MRGAGRSAIADRAISYDGIDDSSRQFADAIVPQIGNVEIALRIERGHLTLVHLRLDRRPAIAGEASGLITIARARVDGSAQDFADRVVPAISNVDVSLGIDRDPQGVRQRGRGGQSTVAAEKSQSHP
jgi:hypothetical protein